MITRNAPRPPWVHGMLPGHNDYTECSPATMSTQNAPRPQWLHGTLPGHNDYTERSPATMITRKAYPYRVLWTADTRHLRRPRGCCNAAARGTCRSHSSGECSKCLYTRHCGIFLGLVRATNIMRWNQRVKTKSAYVVCFFLFWKLFTLQMLHRLLLNFSKF